MGEAARRSGEEASVSFEDDDYDYDHTPNEEQREATKKELRQALRDVRARADENAEKVSEQNQKLYDQAAELRALRAELKDKREHWRPVPIQHEWQPINPQCALCDEPRDSARHTAGNVVPQD